MFRLFKNIISSRQIQIKMQEAITLQDQGKNVQALSLLQNLVKQEPANPNIRHELLRLQKKMGLPLDVQDLKKTSVTPPN